MTQDLILKIFQYVILLFALSLHEASHAWMASRLGDQTARMLGRVTLNPLKHIDPVGTVLIPLFMLFMPGYGRFLIGWARPTPVNSRNFKRFVRDDVMTTLAGPVSNMLMAVICFVALMVLKLSSLGGKLSVMVAIQTARHPGISLEDMGLASAGMPALFPVAMLCYLGVLVNLSLAIFNLLPLPPLDGSHLVRHVLPYRFLRVYDSMGIFGLILILFVGRQVVGSIVAAVLGVIDASLWTL
ncbi:MAG TPA: site-2 protease family protein [Acidisarcina sp.]